MIETEITLAFELSGKKAVRLMWSLSAEYNMNYEVFWKSDVPAGQEYVILGTTNDLEYTTAELENSKTYSFYIRGWYGDQFFYSNVVDLFVSCGKGVALAAEESDGPPCQLAVLGNVKFSDLEGNEGGTISNVVQDPTDKDSFYYLERFDPGDGTSDYKLFRFTWPDINVYLTSITDTGNTLQNPIVSKMPKVAYNPNSGAYHIGFFASSMAEYYQDSVIIDVNLSTLAVTSNTNTINGIGEINHNDVGQVSSFLDGTHLYFCVAGAIFNGIFSVNPAMMKKEAGSTTAYYYKISTLYNQNGITGPLPGAGRFLHYDNGWQDLDFVNMSKSAWAGIVPSYPYFNAGGYAMNYVVSGNDFFRFTTKVPSSPVERYFYRLNPTAGEYDAILLGDIGADTPMGALDIYQRPLKSYYIMVYYRSSAKNKVYISRMITVPQLNVYNTRSIAVPDAHANTSVRSNWINYPYVYCWYGNGSNGESICKICNGVA